MAANFLIDAESNLKAAIGGFGDSAKAAGGQAGAAKGPESMASAAPASPASPTRAAAPAAAVGHQASGTVDSIDLQAGSLSLNHGPVASLKWPAMTMPFKVANTALLKGLTPGQAVNFEFVERQPGDYVVTAITAAPRTGVPASHSGH